jgi:benzoyl-CoA reductase/2-hydroxyglutaryl-CoA dehydratase subunit BcrC/BadD/HgdB
MQPESLSLFTNRGERFLLEADSLRQAGAKVVGVYCTFAPLELIRAAGAVPVGLCGKRQDPIAAAEAHLPANLCPLIKSSYGYALTDTCPYFAASDLLVGETTCDGKKKMFELMGRLKPMQVMQLPHACGPEQLDYWLLALRGLQGFLEQHTGVRVTEDALAQEIRLGNQVRRQLLGIAAFNALPAPLLTGAQMMTVMESRGFVVDQAAYLRDLQALAAELGEMARAGRAALPASAPRVLLTGCPVGKGSEKVLKLVEELGGAVVCQENCTSLKPLDLIVDEQGDPLRALAERYLRTPCSCLTPNQGRLDLIDRLVRQYRVAAVVDLTWHCCHAYNIESTILREHLRQGSGLPLLHLETDYSEGDTGQLRTRIEAFLEMLR